MEAHYECSVCHKFFDEEKNEVEESSLVIGAPGHDYDAVVTDPTCEADGYTTYTCACGDSYVETDTDSKLGHTYGDLVAKVEADCTNDGKEAHYECSVCHKFFDEEKNEVEESSLVIGAPGHDYDAVVTDPTCEADGYTTYTCACGDSYVETDTDSKLGHTYGDLVAKVEADCTNDGKEAHYECSVCHKFFDAEKNEVAEDSLVIAGGHKYVGTECSECHATKKIEVAFEFGADDPSKTATVDGSDLGASKSYTVDGYTLALTNMSKVFGTAYDAKGNAAIKLGTSSVAGSFQFTVPSEITKVIIYVAGRSSATANVSVNGGATQKISTLSDNGAYTAIEVDTTTNKTVTFATVSGGLRCMINTIKFVAGVDCAHEGKIATHQDATCTVAGFNGFRCEACGHAWTTEVLEALDHNMAYTPAKENNCKEAGNIAYYYCSECEGYFADDKGQNAIVGEVTIPADPTKHVDANDDGICDVEGCGANVCDHPEEKVTKVVTAPTCTAKGFTTYTCECGYEWEADEVEAKGHSETEFTYQVDAQDATKHNKLCGDCGANLATEDHTYTDGVCEYCEHEEPVAPSTVTVTAKYSGSTTGNMSTGNNATTIGLDDSIFTVTSEKTNGGNNHVGLNKSGQIRLYKNSTSTMTISVASGYKIVSVKVTSSGGTLKITNGTSTITAVAGVYTINGTTAVFANTGTATMNITAIEIIYAVA